MVVAVNVEDLLALYTENTAITLVSLLRGSEHMCYPERTHSVRPADC